MVKCKECGKDFKRVNCLHLWLKHKMSWDEYLEKYPDTKVTSIWDEYPGRKEKK